MMLLGPTLDLYEGIQPWIFFNMIEKDFIFSNVKKKEYNGGNNLYILPFAFGFLFLSFLKKYKLTQK